jgi:antitoxin (DNA-binding transcriptional repressor) of toxin-antitoxin stability system
LATEVARSEDKGEKITITKHGIPAAILIPPGDAQPKISHAEVVEGMRALRRRVKTGKPGIREMIQTGRRF